MDTGNVTDGQDFLGHRKGIIIASSSAADLVWIICSPILIVVGTVTNVLSIIVLTRKQMRKHTTMFYLTVLSVGDICVLFFGLFRIWTRVLLDIDYRNISEFMCKMQAFLSYFLLQFTSWTLVAVTVDRYISVCLPFKCKDICTRQNARVAIFGIFMTLAVLNFPLFLGVNLEKDGESVRCTNHQILNWYVWAWFDMCVYCIIPFLIMVTCNILITKRLAESYRKVKVHTTQSYPSASDVSLNENVNDARKTIDVTKHMALSRVIENHLQVPNDEIRKSSLRSIQRVISKCRSEISRRRGLNRTPMLLTVNWAYLLLTTPIGVYLIVHLYWYIDNNSGLQWAIVNMLQYSNNAIHFFLYCITGSKFRSELRNIFSCKRK